MKPPIVAFAACPDYGAGLAPALDGLLGHLGGWEAVVRPGQKVLVKPNLLADAPPSHAVTTHPELVRHVVRGLRRAGATVQVGDSPASAMSLERVWQVSGVAEVCAAEGVPLLSFEKGGTRQVSRDGYVFAIAGAVMDADLIVNLPKVKSHGLTTLTAAVKNFYGVLPGYQKTQLHQAYPKPDRFCRLLRTLHAVLPRSFSVADAVVGMEGEGPANGRPVNLGFLAASEDAVALDLAICRALGLDPRRVPYLADRAEGAACETRGAPPAGLRFRAAAGGAHLLRLVPEPLLRLASPLVWVRPLFDARCTGCGRCAAACPARALRIEPGGRPRLTPRLCIACCCCHEVCPANGVRMRRSPLLRLLGVFRDLR
jgi:uncharacterized protein (DUF362 family)/Pyruvate/2-oxoacid:ferredoxin oxidoreductase delta subunit